jgi:glycosyltransferase involved in cell wall biosynthesis
MLLVDSLYINVGGGKVLLDYLVKEIEARQIDVFYLFDLRCKNDFKQVPSDRKVYLKASFFNRYKFYKRNKENFSKILCFGNIPPPIKLKEKYVLTFFQNTLMVNPPHDYSLNKKIKVGLQKKYLEIFKRNTNSWLIQTDFVKDELTSHLDVNSKDCFVYPFFEISDSISSSTKIKNTYTYVGSGAEHKNIKRLLDAWTIIFDKGFSPTLHLTIPVSNVELIDLIHNLKELGLQIENHGYISKEEVHKLYSISEYLVFPSLTESFGLPLLEAVTAGCKVIASDLDYTHNVIKPSLVFNPMNIDSIADAIIFSLKNELMPSETKVKNEIDQILKILS